MVELYGNVKVVCAIFGVCARYFGTKTTLPQVHDKRIRLLLIRHHYHRGLL